MGNIVQYTLGAAINVIGVYYIWSKLLHKKIDLKKLKTYLIFVILAIVILLNYYFVNVFLKVILITIILMPCVYILFDEKINKSIITPIFSQLMVMVSEIIFAIVLMLLNVFSNLNIVDTIAGALITNLSITLIAISMLKLKFVSVFYEYLISITKKIKLSIILLVLISLIIIISTVYGVFYYGNNILIIFFTDAVLCLLYAFFIFKMISDKHRYIKVYDKYNTTLDSLKEYEDILNKYRISNHENKNHLLMIRNMTKDKQISKYIDEILDRKQKDNEKLMIDVCVIPEGGLRGLIYSKLLYMNQKKIKGNLNVDKKIKIVDFLNVESSLMLDICKIVGVFIDNAIEEVIKLKNKNIEIAIYLCENNLNISVSNNYNGIIELDNIEKAGYTTKGPGHGYGLSLIKDIIENNNKLSNEKKISKNVFTQILKIKM